MIRKDLYTAIILPVLLLTALFSGAQVRTTVKATIDRNKILIGEPIHLNIEAGIPENEPIHFFIIDSIPHFEFLKKQEIDTVNTSSGTVLRQTITLTSFDSGHWVIPSFVLSENIATDTLPVDVGFSPFDPAQEYHDIKDILEVKPEQQKKKWWLWYAIGGGILLVGLILYFLLRKRKPAPVAVAPPINPYEEAMKELDKLRRDRGDQKKYYSQLVDIFRVYVYRKKGIQSLQKTTDDLVVQLKGIPMSKEAFERLSKSLRLSDFVKFARYAPTPENDLATLEIIKATISEIEQLK